MFNIHRQAKYPDINAEKKPTKSAEIEMLFVADVKSPPIRLKKPSPKIGTITIRKENFATLSLLLPKMIPVAMVDPDLDSPGSTAQA